MKKPRKHLLLENGRKKVKQKKSDCWRSKVQAKTWDKGGNRKSRTVLLQAPDFGEASS